MLAVNLGILLGLLLLMEVIMRWSVTFDPGYYTGVRSNNSCIDYPYGRVCLNSNGFPDVEFERSSQKYRIGYIGDSVCYGVGAGQSGRITTRLGQAFPDFDHLNFCYVGENVLSRQTLKSVLRIVRKFSIDQVVYLMNLNDVGPLAEEMRGDAEHTDSGSSRATSILVRLKKLLIPLDERLRGRSYLYTWFRNKIKERLTVAGYEASGYEAVEFFPTKHARLFEYAAQKIVWLRKTLEASGVKFTLVLLPYEMQTSTHAASVYHDLRISSEKGFSDGSAQTALIDSFEEPVAYIDARFAFDGVRATARIGENFVYDKGDKIDWNHPNRDGHKLIADYIARQRPFAGP